MKPVLFTRRKYSWKDIVKMVSIYFGHYFFFLFYAGIILAIRFTWTHEFFPNIDYKNWLLFYPVTLAPAISATLHIIYAEKGLPWLRFAMWVHVMFNIVIVPIIVLV